MNCKPPFGSREPLLFAVLPSSRFRLSPGNALPLRGHAQTWNDGYVLDIDIHPEELPSPLPERKPVRAMNRDVVFCIARSCSKELRVEQSFCRCHSRYTLFIPFQKLQYPLRTV